MLTVAFDYRRRGLVLDVLNLCREILLELSLEISIKIFVIRLIYSPLSELLYRYSIISSYNVCHVNNEDQHMLKQN